MRPPRQHLLVQGRATAVPYKPIGGGGAELMLPPRERSEHGCRLREQLEQACDEAQMRRKRGGGVGIPRGITLQLRSELGSDLALEPLDLPSQGIALLSTRYSQGVHEATIHVPDGKLGLLFGRIYDYLAKETPNGGPRHRALIESISELCLATLEGLWTDSAPYPSSADERVWWEVWLRHDEDANGLPELDRLRRQAEDKGFEVDGRAHLRFPDRTVVLVFASPRQLSAALDRFDDIAELRAAKTATEFFTGLSSREQGDWVRDLRGRVEVALPDAPAVCLLDTGIQHEHPLFRGLIDEADIHAVEPSWGAHDHGPGGPHGTPMAGLAIFGDLGPLLESRDRVALTHRLESVKILPPPPAKNKPALYGFVTAKAIARCEKAAPTRNRVIAMAVTTDGLDQGRPSSWSAAIDSLATGYDDGDYASPRLLIVSAGNRDYANSLDYYSAAVTDGIFSPGQSWNALTIGACTDRVALRDPTFADWQPLATRPEDLSPHSTTSITWASAWPIKPELVFEGGNAAVNTDGAIDLPNDLCLLSTAAASRDVVPQLTRMWGTSAATALAARIAASLRAAYPKAWPETIRALLVHSARWSDAMWARVADLKGREQVRNLVRSFGYGTPDVARARSSFDNALTLIVEDQLEPYAKDSTAQMHFHRLPWPRAELRALGDTPAMMRVVLSYFVEPNPGERGWQYKHRYASHGLRFDVQTPTESLLEFRRRINGAIREQIEGRLTGSDAGRWELGPDLRSAGSLHVDTWRGTTAELASRETIAVFPVVGWWRERPQLGRARPARYSLVVAIETEQTRVDLYSIVENLIAVPASPE
jgi:Subtilase family